MGLIGALAPDEAPLLGAISLIGPAIAMGNPIVLVPSAPYPLAMTDFYQVLETSDVPAGVINLVTGDPAVLAPTLAEHLELDAMWSFSSADLSRLIEAGSVGNLKRTWVNNGKARNWFGPEGQGRQFLNAATEVKTIWVPYGE